MASPAPEPSDQSRASPGSEDPVSRSRDAPEGLDRFIGQASRHFGERFGYVWQKEARPGEPWFFVAVVGPTNDDRAFVREHAPSSVDVEVVPVRFSVHQLKRWGRVVNTRAAPSIDRLILYIELDYDHNRLRIGAERNLDEVDAWLRTRIPPGAYSLFRDEAGDATY